MLEFSSLSPCRMEFWLLRAVPDTSKMLCLCHCFVEDKAALMKTQLTQNRITPSPHISLELADCCHIVWLWLSATLGTSQFYEDTSEIKFTLCNDEGLIWIISLNFREGWEGSWMVVTAQLSSEPVSDITLSMTFTAGLLATILEEPGLAGGHPWPRHLSGQQEL